MRPVAILWGLRADARQPRPSIYIMAAPGFGPAHTERSHSENE